MLDFIPTPDCNKFSPPVKLKLLSSLVCNGDAKELRKKSKSFATLVDIVDFIDDVVVVVIVVVVSNVDVVVDVGNNDQDLIFSEPRSFFFAKFIVPANLVRWTSCSAPKLPSLWPGGAYNFCPNNKATNLLYLK